MSCRHQGRQSKGATAIDIRPRSDYLFGEKVYIILSLTAKALLAWQIFFPVLMSGK